MNASFSGRCHRRTVSTALSPAHPLLLVSAWTLCALFGAGAALGPDLLAQQAYTPQTYTPRAPAPAKAPAATASKKKETRSYTFSPGYVTEAAAAIRPTLSAGATFLVQESTGKIIVQDDAANIATADQIALALDPAVQGIPGSTGTRYYATTANPAKSNNGTSGVILPRTGSAPAAGDASPAPAPTPAATVPAPGITVTPVAATASPRIVVEVDMDEGPPAGTPSGTPMPDTKRRQSFTMESGKVMRFQIARSPQLDYFRLIAGEAGYPVATGGQPWSAVSTQLALKPVAHGNDITVTLYPELVADMQNGAQQVLPLEKYGTSVTVSAGQEANLNLFPIGTQDFNDAFFGRPTAGAPQPAGAAPALTGSITIRARLQSADNAATSTAAATPAAPLQPPVQPLQPTVVYYPVQMQPQQQQQQQQPVDGGSYSSMYVGTETPYIDYGGYYGGYYPTTYYNNGIRYCGAYKIGDNGYVTVSNGGNCYPRHNYNYSYNKNSVSPYQSRYSSGYSGGGASVYRSSGGGAYRSTGTSYRGVTAPTGNGTVRKSRYY
ncbi:hypothetical protein DB346_22055 [Verrucomicrobia bacterium LW23]|nr:hypothetical protein DB346_22055 [Verrucomicrobia bacterium LW23]